MEIRAKIFQPAIKAQISTPEIRAKLTGGGISLTLSGLQVLLNEFPEYANDEDAVADGLVLNDIYWVAEGSDSNIPGNLRRVTNV